MSRSEAIDMIENIEFRLPISQNFLDWINVRHQGMVFMLEQHRNREIWVGEEANYSNKIQEL